MTTLKQDYDSLSKMGMLDKDIPDYIQDNLNPTFKLRAYQNKAISRFIHYLNLNPNRIKPSQLLFHMATGSGKTLLMGANILYLYKKGYRNFIFFVNSTNIIDKTRENFLNPESSKYLFNQKIKFEDKEVQINEVDNFEVTNKDDINIIFSTIQGLHSLMTTHRENCLTYEDFKDNEIVIISDEAHHINSWTKNKLGKQEEIAKTTWEYTVNSIFNSNSENIMLEYTATVDLENYAINEKYQNKILYEYTLKQFRQDGFSKEVKVLQADLSNIERALQALILSQYRRKIAEKNRLHLKPVILLKSKTIDDSKDFEHKFQEKIENLTVNDIEKLKIQSAGNVLERAFSYFEKEKITFSNLATELKEDFSIEKCISVNSQNESDEKQLLVNSLEDKNNEVRAIFAVDKLNEGWDVLNLFDIVRLYETRDSKGNKPGKTTIAEAQLIGRGARYFPFKLKDEDEKFKRKFDQEPENDLKIIEELFYHSSHNPKYIQELNIALRNSGILPPQEPKTIQLEIKEDFKKSDLWKNGFIFINQKKEADRSKIKDINDLDVSTIYKWNLRTGFTQDKKMFEDESNPEQDKVTRVFELKFFNESILRKAIAKLDFYKFDNLKKYFPNLNSIQEFIESLKLIKAEIRSSADRLNNITPDDKLDVCLNILNKLETQIKAGFTEFKGTKLFVQNEIKEIVKDKTLNINVGDISDQEFGIAMSKTTKDDLRLNLADKDWYVYGENYGTSEEKHFIQFINGIIGNLKDKYSEVYLLRNANLFKIYRFSDGCATEPDFVLFLNEIEGDKHIQYQLFIEPKGNLLLRTADKWKEDFLREIESNYEIEILGENEEYKLMGLPFYNQDTKITFIEAFNQKVRI